ncbi:MAG: AraC family transcriptional regulator [Bacteroidota bacterium]
MENFYKYLQTNHDFGYDDLVVVNAGHTKVSPNSAYPAIGHPSHHNFNFVQGRVIDEYQMIYISQGKGLFESKSFGETTVEAGDTIFLFPGEWHRYKPDESTGWTENWIGFTGRVSMLNNKKGLISAKQPIVKVGLHDGFLKLFITIFELVKADFTGIEYTISGAANHLLGHALTQKKRALMNVNSKTDELIMKAKILLEENFTDLISMEDIAARLNISYVWFRTYFKKHTGYSPYEYLLNIKVNHAKILLQNTTSSVKEVASLSGFNSQNQFSKIFKSKTGKSPSDYR